MDLSIFKKITPSIFILTILIVCFLLYFVWSERESTAYKILYLQEYCLGLDAEFITIDEVRSRLKDSILEIPLSSSVTTFTTSRLPFSPTCRIEYKEENGQVTKSSFIRD